MNGRISGNKYKVQPSPKAQLCLDISRLHCRILCNWSALLSSMSYYMFVFLMSNPKHTILICFTICKKPTPLRRYDNGLRQKKPELSHLELSISDQCHIALGDTHNLDEILLWIALHRFTYFGIPNVMDIVGQ